MEREPDTGIVGDDPRDGDPDAPELEEQADAIADFVEELLERMGIDAIAEPTTTVATSMSTSSTGRKMIWLSRSGGMARRSMRSRSWLGPRWDGAWTTASACWSTWGTTGSGRRSAGRAGEEIAERVQRTGEEEHFEPMNAYERKLVHDVIAEFDTLESVSEGADPDRFVVVRPL